MAASPADRRSGVGVGGAATAANVPGVRHGLSPLLVLLALASCADDPTPGEQRAEQARDLAAEAGLPEDVGGVLALAAGVADAAYRVTYDDAGGDTVTVTAGPEGRRVDVTGVEAEGEDPVTRSFFTLEDGSFTCRLGADRWFCARDDEPAPEIGRFADADVSRAVTALAEAADEYAFRVEERRIADVDARCLVTERRADAPPDPSAATTGTLCVSPEGVPLLVEQAGDDQRATAYTTDVPDDALVLPAEADGPPDPDSPASIP